VDIECEFVLGMLFLGGWRPVFFLTLRNISKGASHCLHWTQEMNHNQKARVTRGEEELIK
jgi:hypothetical protein